MNANQLNLWMVEAERAVHAWGFTWSEWSRMAARPDYVATAFVQPCICGAPGCYHVLAGTHGLN